MVFLCRAQRVVLLVTTSGLRIIIHTMSQWKNTINGGIQMSRADEDLKAEIGPAMRDSTKAFRNEIKSLKRRLTITANRLASLEAIVGGYESLIQDTEWSTKAMDLRAAGLNEALAAWRKDGEG